MSMTMTRRALLTSLAAGMAAAFRPGRLGAQAKIPLTVYKDPSCTCCEKWVQHMTANGFSATVTNTSNIAAIKARYKVPSPLESCHTAIAGGYVIEGHVPAADAKRLLAQKPAGIVGLSIPGMPASAPGMDVLPFQPYIVLSFDAAGRTTPFAKHTQ